MIAAAVVAAAMVLAAVWLFNRRWRERLLWGRRRRRVIVTLKSGAAFEGVLFEIDGACLVLRETRTFGEREEIVVDGEALILRGDVAYLQVL